MCPCALLDDGTVVSSSSPWLPFTSWLLTESVGLHPVAEEEEGAGRADVGGRTDDDDDASSGGLSVVVSEGL